MKTKDIKDKLTRKKKKRKITAADYLSTGSTLLNLACTGKPNRGFLKGKYYFLVGDSTSGKTFLSLTCLAEAANNPAFDNHRFIFDNNEDGALMDIKRFFGKKVYKRIESPNARYLQLASQTIEEFYYNLDDAVKDERPFIYILDSMDSLSSEYEGDKFEEHKKAHRKGKTAPGSYGDGKAKINSSFLRGVISDLRKQRESILIIINQTRDNLGFGFEKKTRSGGHALKFYACLEIWSSVKGRIKKTVKGKERQLGTMCKVKIKKNRQTGREREVLIPIYHSFGIDDIGSCVNWLVAEGFWETIGQKIDAPEFDVRMNPEKLIRYIEENELEKDLRELVTDGWNEIEKACEVKRKRRYE